MSRPSYIPAYWFPNSNFGDNLTPYIIRGMTGLTPALMDMNHPGLKYMVTGSIMAVPVVNASVWGCGIAFKNQPIPFKAHIWAVRGHLTGEALKAQNHPFNEVYGDPAMLLPRLFTPSITQKFDVGIIPHYVDTAIVYDGLALTPTQLLTNGIKIIDIQQDIESVIKDILSCRRILSSSLHGLIVSNAYKIPNAWVKFSNLLGGDDTKFYDYFSTVDKKSPSFIGLRDIKNHDKVVMQRLKMYAEQFAEYNEPTVDLDALYNSCPFKNL